jgi:hypothetical protein
MSKLTPSCPFGKIGKDPIWTYDHISLPVTFRTIENFRI